MYRTETSFAPVLFAAHNSGIFTGNLGRIICIISHICWIKIVFYGLYFGISYFAENMGLSIYQQNHPSSGTAIGSYLKDLAVGGDYDTSLLSAAFDNLKEEGSEGLELFTLTVTVSGTYTQNTYTTTFVMGDSSSETVITGVTLDPAEIVFSGSVSE